MSTSGFQPLNADRAAAQTGLSRADVIEVAEAKGWNADRITPDQLQLLKEIKQTKDAMLDR